LETEIENTVLIVDDNQANVALINHVLKKHNMKTNFAFSGQEALDIEEQNPPNLIILDINMPDMDGFEICKRLKFNKRTKDIPIIFLSAYNNPELIVKGFNLGVVDYITKPFNNAEIIARVKTHLEIQNKIKIIKNQNIRLKNKESKFRNIFNSSKDGIIIIDDSGQILEANSIVSKRNNITRDEIINLNIAEIVNKDRAIKLHKLVKEVTTKNSLITETQYYTKTGEKVFLELNISKIVFNGIKSFLIVSRDITQRRLTDKQILNTIIETEEKERTKFSQELHDGIGPMLSTIKMYFEWLSETEDVQKKKIIVEKGNLFINETINELRTISNNISPIVLKNFGLIYAIKNFIERIKEISTIKFIFNYNCNERISSILEFTIYRILTELINNTIKHTKANEIKIDFDLDEKTKILRLNYFDNGHGFNIKEVLAKSKGMGITNIYHRIKTTGGSIKINSEKSALNISIKMSTKD